MSGARRRLPLRELGSLARQAQTVDQEPIIMDLAGRFCDLLSVIDRDIQHQFETAMAELAGQGAPTIANLMRTTFHRVEDSYGLGFWRHPSLVFTVLGLGFMVLLVLLGLGYYWWVTSG